MQHRGMTDSNLDFEVTVFYFDPERVLILCSPGGRTEGQGPDSIVVSKDASVGQQTQRPV